ncbi:hypothetical protein NIES4071_03420 [Calothrix sp. NIES-4071]|nr:hypothetical protein NIES4071_03420 [Calothrix sp. NIES-4071]BAZ54688.1 hypothetical protein NIES4105_03410 [Calothrix sp. NIES-4105]
MTQKNWCIQLLFASLLVLINTPYVTAQSTPPRFNSILRNLRRAPSLKYKLPPKGAPGQRTDAGSRSECSALDGRLVALVPPTNIGLTAAMRPTFWFYIPSKADKSALGKFQLLDDEENVVYTTNIAINTSDITSINLPLNLSLEVGKKYQWVLSFTCNSSTQASALVYGYIERVAVDDQMQQRLNTATTERDRIIIYGENGLWFDMLTALITQIRNQPQDLQLRQDWEDLLKSPEVNLFF